MHVRIFLRDLQRRVHVAERGREDQLVAGAGELLDRALGVRTFADVLEKGGLDLVAELLHHRLAAELVLIGPAEIADRAEIDEADLQLVGGGSAARLLRRAISAAAAAMRVFLMCQSPITEGVNCHVPMRARPIAHASEYVYRSGTNTVPSEAGAVEPPVPRARNQNQHDDGREIGQRRHELRGNADARSLAHAVAGSSPRRTDRRRSPAGPAARTRTPPAPARSSRGRRSCRE